MPMRALVVAPDFPPAVGGMATYAERVAAILSAKGHAIHVLTARQNASSNTGALGYTVTRTLTGRYAGDVRRIRDAAIAFRDEVIFLTNAGYAGVTLDVPCPVVARSVGNDVYGAWLGPRVPLRFLYWRLPHAPGSLGARLRRLDQERRVRAVRAGLSRCATVICNSSYTKERLRAEGIPEPKLEVVVGGVDVHRFSPRDAAATRERSDPREERPGDFSLGRASRHADGRVLIGTAGALKPIKGFSVAIAALAELAPRRPNLHLVIAGDGPERATLETLATSLGVRARVEFLGNVPLDEMPDFHRSLAVYVQPSVPIHHPESGAPQQESMGRSLCEAQACGVPVVASRSGGIPEVVEDDQTGILIPPGDPSALADAIQRLVTDPARARRLGSAGRAMVVDRFSWERVVSMTEGLLAQAIEESAYADAR